MGTPAVSPESPESIKEKEVMKTIKDITETVAETIGRPIAEGIKEGIKEKLKGGGEAPPEIKEIGTSGEKVLKSKIKELLEESGEAE